MMKKLFELIEALLRGEFDEQMRHEEIMTIEGILEHAGLDAEAELKTEGGREFAFLFTEELWEIGEEYDAGTDETIAEYKRRVAELYERAKKMLEDKRADGKQVMSSIQTRGGGSGERIQ